MIDPNGLFDVVAVGATCTSCGAPHRGGGIGATPTQSTAAIRTQYVATGPSEILNTIVCSNAVNVSVGETWTHDYSADTTLYRMEPMTKTFAVVGPLTGCNGMADIAVDKDGRIVGVGTELYAIDPASGACTKIANGPQPYTLTFIPAGTLDPTEEALVAFSGSDYYRVNRTTGALTRHGHVVKNLGSIGRSGVFGLGAWGGKLYGFLDDGETCEITIGASTVTSSTIVPNPTKPASWIGGGSSTAAPQ